MFLKVNDDVAGNVPVDPEDTLKVKKALNRIGRYPVPSYGMTKYPDQPMLDGIKQIQRDHDLFLDGTIKPKGPTEGAINKELRNAQLLPPGKDIPQGSPGNWIKSQIESKRSELASKQSLASRLAARFDATSNPLSRNALRSELARIKQQIEQLDQEIQGLRRQSQKETSEHFHHDDWR